MACFRFRFSFKCVINGCSGYYAQTQKSPLVSGHPTAIHLSPFLPSDVKPTWRGVYLSTQTGVLPSSTF